MKLRILQTSDWHYGATVLPSNHNFGRELEKQRRSEEENLLDNIIKVVRDQEVDLVLLPGDLWDQENVPFSLVRDLVIKLGSIAPIPVLIAPGNHDFLGKDSLYHDENIATYGAKWPDNVFVFTNHEFESIQIPGIDGVSFTAMAAGANVEIDERLVTSELPKSISGLNILLYHGSRLADFENFPYRSKITAPFSDDEIFNSGFDYIALGHYHSHQVIKDGEGKIRAAYSGEPFQRQFRNITDNGLIVFNLTENGVDTESFKVIKVDERCYRKIEINLNGGTDEEKVLDLIATELKNNNVTPDDYVQIVLKGRFGAGNMWRPIFDNKEAAYAVSINTASLSTEFDLEEAINDSPAGSAEYVFIQRLQEKLNNPEINEDEKRTLKMVLQIGLYAFRGIFTELHTDPIEAIK